MESEKIEAIRIAFQDALSSVHDGQQSLVEPTVYDRYRRARKALSGDEALPSYVEGEIVEDLVLAKRVLVEVASDLFNAGDDEPRINPLDFRIVWRTGEWKQGVSAIAGECKPVPHRERDLYEVEPGWQITINAAWWCALDREGRRRLMHHELMHAVTQSKCHPVEEWPETVREFGLSNRAQALFVVEAMNRKGFRKELQALLRDEDPAIPEWVR